MGGYGGSYSFSTSNNTLRKSAVSYNASMGRSYVRDAEWESREKLPPPKNKELHTDAKLPIVIAVDVTGSMRHWPGTIFEKLCVLYNEALVAMPEEYKESFEISFVAVGDAYTDFYPIQVTDFDKEVALDENIKKLFPEGNGGGQTRETYELVAYYYARHCEMPNAEPRAKPLFFYICDEGYYSNVKKDHVEKYFGDEIEEDIPSEDVFDELMEKFRVYALRIAYSRNARQVAEHDEARISKDWKNMIGPENVILMDHPERVVDVILGLIAGHLGEVNAFAERIELRQTPEQVRQVYDTLQPAVQGVIDRLGVDDIDDE